MNSLDALIIAVIAYVFFYAIIPRKRAEIVEATPYQFEKDEPIEDYNEVHEALRKLRNDIDVSKREGKL
jgi:hypothetical protein